MGTRSLSLTSLRKFARVESVRTKTARSAQSKPALKSLASSREGSATAMTGDAPGAGKLMEGSPGERVPLSNVVADCVRRWFRDALEEAKAGDAAMQVLVGQMYQNGYGIPQNEQKVRTSFSFLII
ncbi:hypothetical protein KSP39_PZI020834 [Platanthera zijinensis]|uniref:Uncharacterized protein n=1 Tax=Platanthera zijinensis TaxID=2320716 RepID=A0AAP0B0V7_9ASPA